MVCTVSKISMHGLYTDLFTVTDKLLLSLKTFLKVILRVLRSKINLSHIRLVEFTQLFFSFDDVHLFKLFHFVMIYIFLYEVKLI